MGKREKSYRASGACHRSTWIERNGPSPVWALHSCVAPLSNSQKISAYVWVADLQNGTAAEVDAIVSQTLNPTQTV